MTALSATAHPIGPFRSGMSLRIKGLALIGLLVAYYAGVGALLLYERAVLLDDVASLQRLYAIQELLVESSTVVRGIAPELGAGALSFNAKVLGTLDDTIDALRTIESRGERHTSVSAALFAVIHLRDAMAARPRGLAPEDETVRVITRGVNELASAIAELRERRARVERVLAFHSQSVAGVTVVIGTLGLASLGSLVFLFMTRLVNDLRSLGERATKLVDGYRGAPLPIARRDEVGALTEAVNRLGDGLRARDLKIEFDRTRRYQHDKMAAMGALASNMAHEVCNPVAAIVGVAQAIHDEQRLSACVHHGSACHPQIILEQAERIAAITRRLADFAAARSGLAQPLDLNALVDSACELSCFDRRFDDIELRRDLGNNIHAAHAVAGDLVQVLGGLLANAAQAIAQSPNAARSIEVCTRQDNDAIVLEVHDGATRNASLESSRPLDLAGLDRERLEMMVFRTLVEGMGGQICVGPSPRGGTSVAIKLRRASDGERRDVS